ncbi:quorum-sensing autoinducer 2 sensor kinase/phosphatase LuxQ [Vibrio nitrifigilis]|uniref:Autoinducer 2 sensor kinase/phosphatase LuxQ n=1 Tax=Vibrio nitrifigilis TaxID=2789781 RepID=A0ABS0GL05_9VIBR|nr:quorum-sensing autoinducer 2 sensor kinase/phosphatase LuxQ [Vibrio nitrifigilis]MBF9003005.1 response regulator [Vibrio nitrifigilis]
MSIRTGMVRPKKRIANFISYAIVVVLGALTLSVLFQSYQISSRLMSQEVKRTSGQTANLIQSLFNFRLASVQIHQDSSAQSQSLIEALESKNPVNIDQYFVSVDQLELSNTPDIRFITTMQGLAWDDGNAQFYGMEKKQLDNIIRKVAFNSNWHLLSSPSQLDKTYLLVRRSPLINQKTGEVAGFLYVGIVLNNNYALVETMRDGSNSQNLVLTVGKKVITSTLNGNEPYREADVIKSGLSDTLYNRNMVTRAPLEVEGVPTYLTVYSVQNNQNALRLRDNYYFWMIFALVAMVIVAGITRWWLQRRIESEIDGLMTYTHQVADKGSKNPFPGSTIYEFDHFGRTLEHTFMRLAEQEKQFEDLFNFTASPTILWWPDGQLIKMNPSARKQFIRQYDDETLLFSQLEQQLLPNIFEAAKGFVIKSVNTELGGKMFRWNLSPIEVDDKIESIIAQGHDVTSITEAEKQSRIARKEAEESARLRADFLAKMSHELRTPLNGILGVSQLLKRTVTDQEQIEQVNVLCTSGEHLLAVLNDILDFSRLEQGKFRIQKNEFRLSEMTGALTRIYQPLCNEKGLNLNVQSNFNESVMVYGDQVRINQILFNLLNNAIKFTHHGEIGVELELVKNSSTSRIKVVVTDTGIGIREADLRIIFDPFMQAESTTTREYGGSGLGLAIVKSLVDMLGGTIDVHSQPGQGTQFTFEIPLEVLANQASVSPNISADVQYSLFDETLTVLLVEDNHTNAFIARAFCKKYGLNVDWVTDGLQAIEKVQTNHYDLILMDNQLPYLGGIDATIKIKQELKLDVPVYACTADGMESTRDAFMNAGASYVLVKPIKEASLHKALTHFKQQHNMAK